jgi:Flp pilus assembly protein TadG
MIANHNILKCERGNSFVEMAFAAPILATLIIGLVDLSTAYSAELALEQAAQRTIERVQQGPYTTTENATLETEAETAAGTGSNATVSSWLECNGDGVRLNFNTGTCATGAPYARHVEVTVTKPFDPLFGRFFPGASTGGTVTLDATAGIRVQ